MLLAVGNNASTALFVENVENLLSGSPIKASVLAIFCLLHYVYSAEPSALWLWYRPLESVICEIVGFLINLTSYNIYDLK